MLGKRGAVVRQICFPDPFICQCFSELALARDSLVGVDPVITVGKQLIVWSDVLVIAVEGERRVCPCFGGFIAKGRGSAMPFLLACQVPSLAIV